jgi:hypothetical protein
MPVFAFVMEANEFFVYRVDLRRFSSIDVLKLRNGIQEWLFDHTKEEAMCGMGFDEPRRPRLSDPSGKTLFILFRDLDDAEAFEDVFDVRGYTPVLVR